ncbi:hypothetical protein LINGRAHAP2_LOCUS33540 [Linum grandiflorum]
MARQSILSRLGSRKKQPLLSGRSHPKPEMNISGEERGSDQNRPRLERSHAMPPKRIWEVAGGAAAVCCYCEKEAAEVKEGKAAEPGLLAPTGTKLASGEMDGSREELEREVREVVERGKAEGMTAGKEAVDLEKKMCSQFYGTGF